MAAKGKSFCKAQRNLQGLAAILKSAACEWLLIFLMLIDALLSYVLTKFAYICNLQTPCILCSRLDHLLGKEKPNNYRNLLCTNHRLEISSLVSCYKHNKLVDGNEMCDACLCSFATYNKPNSNPKLQRLLVGKLRSDSCGNGAQGQLLNRDSNPHGIRTRPCSCCSKPLKTRPNAQGLMQLKSSVNATTKSHIPLPRRLYSRDSLKKMRDKISGSVALQHPGKTGFNLLSRVGYSELNITSDSESEVLLSEDDDDDGRRLICEKSELKEDSVLQSITRIPLKLHCNNCDQVKPSINFFDSRPSPLESYVQVDVQKPHNVKSFASDATTFHGLSEFDWLPRPANHTAYPSDLPELICLDDASSPAPNALVLPRHNSMEKTNLADSLSQDSTVSSSPLEFTASNHNPQVVEKLTTCEETGTCDAGIKSLNELEDHSTLINTTAEECPKTDEVVYDSAIRETTDIDHSDDSESSKSSKSSKSSESSESGSDKKTGISDTGIEYLNELEDHSTLISTTVEEYSKTDELVYDSAIRNTNDVEHSDDSESSESGSDKETGTCDTGIESLNELEDRSTLISTTVEEYSKTDEVVYDSAIRNTNDIEHSDDSESSKSGSDKETGTCDTGIESLNELGDHSTLINTTIEECPKSDEVVYDSAIRETNDIDHSDDSESSKSGSDKKTGISDTVEYLNELGDHSSLISTTVQECLKTDEVVNDSAIRDRNDIDHSDVFESSESGSDKETGTCDMGIKSFNKLEDHSTLINTTVEECPKSDEVVYDSAIRNTKDIDHSDVCKSSESGSDKETGTCDTIIESLNKIEDHCTLISTTGEECPKVDEVVYDSAIKNTNDIDHNDVSESSKSGSDKEQEVLNFSTGPPLEKEPDIDINDPKEFPFQSSSAELTNQSSDDEGHNTSSFCDELPEGFASQFNIIRVFDRSVSVESDVESLDGSNVSEIEGENMVDRLKRQVEYDRKCINSLYRELEEERSASEVAASQAMAMITRLQEEKASMHMEALQYLRMMEEQAEYDVEALEKANELLTEKDRDIQDLESEVEFCRANHLNDTIVVIEQEKTDGANGKKITAENDAVGYREYNGNYSFKSTNVEASKGSNISLNLETLSLGFEDEKIYIQLCLKSLEDKINKISANGVLSRVTNCIDFKEVVNSEQKGEESDAESSPKQEEQNCPSIQIDKNSSHGTDTSEEESVDRDSDGRFGHEESFPDKKGQISCVNNREEVNFLALEHKISDLTDKLEALQADYDFLEHSLNSLRYGEEGLQFVQNIVHQLQELCKLGIKLERQSSS